MAFKAIDPNAKPTGDEAMSMMSEQERKDYMTQNMGGRERMRKQMDARPASGEMPMTHMKHPGMTPVPTAKGPGKTPRTKTPGKGKRARAGISMGTDSRMMASGTM